MGYTKINLTTKRLSLVQFDIKYAQEMFTGFDTEITRYMYGKPNESIQDVLNFINLSQKNMKNGKELVLVYTLTKTGEFLGAAGLHNINSRTPEFGIWLKKSAHGHGYGREAATALHDWAVINLKYDYLKYPVDKNNRPSKKIPVSLDGVAEDEYKKTNASGYLLDLVEYSIYKS